MAQPPVTVYGFAFSPFVRAVRIYAQEVGVPHHCGMTIAGREVGFKSPEHLAHNPFGKIPVLVDGDVSVYESASICRYLDARAGAAGRLQTLDPVQRAQVDQWSGAITSVGQDALMRGFMLEIAFPKGEDGSVRLDVIRDNLPEAQRFLAVIEQQLQRQTWIASSDYSMADSILTPFLHYAKGIGPQIGEGELLGKASEDYLKRVLARPSAGVLNER